MKSFFTICSNNYLAQAKVMVDSFLTFNPNYRAFVVICDELRPEIDYSDVGGATVIWWKNIIGSSADDLIDKYNIVELNTSIKPSVFKYLLSVFTEIKYLFYLDPDIEVFHSFTSLEENLESWDILISPHVTGPVPIDNQSPEENVILNYGLYNLGFACVKADSLNTESFLNWWEERTLNRCFNNLRDGYFVDQLWVNLAPIYFDKVKILKDLGVNVAPWNLHEREVTNKIGNTYLLQNGNPLLFYHFSSYKYSNHPTFSPFYNRVRFDNAPPLLVEIYDNYRKKLISKDIMFFSKIDYAYLKIVEEPKKVGMPKKIVFLFAPPLSLKIYYHVKMFCLRLIIQSKTKLAPLFPE